MFMNETITTNNDTDSFSEQNKNTDSSNVACHENYSCNA